jgi:Flp pilus assembly protein TadD
VSLLAGIAVALVVGVVLGVLSARWRTRRTAVSAPDDVASLLRVYRRGQYQSVVDSAPTVAATMGAATATTWRARVELVWGHSLFQLDRYREAIPHLRRGLDQSPRPQEGEARFRHCLGYALQQSGDQRGAREVYEELLRDADLDPQVREGVKRHLSELDAGGGG